MSMGLAGHPQFSMENTPLNSWWMLHGQSDPGDGEPKTIEGWRADEPDIEK